MASCEQTFPLDITSSDDEFQSPPQYRTAALPELTIPSPFQSDESSLIIESGSGTQTPSTLGTPLTFLSSPYRLRHQKPENLQLLCPEISGTVRDAGIT